MNQAVRKGSANQFSIVVAGALVALVVLGMILYNLGRPDAGDWASGTRAKTEDARSLLMYCAAGTRLPVEDIVAAYKRDHGVTIQIQFNGSNTLLSQIELARTGDLYLAADVSYTALAQDKGLVHETIPLALQRPVIAVRKGNPKGIRGVEDLWRDDMIVAMGNPDQAAIGKSARSLLTESGHWGRLEQHVTRMGVFKPTVPEVANDIEIGSADAGIIWDTTLAMYDNLEAIRTDELDAGISHVTIAVLVDSRTPASALHFARYLSARDRGLVSFEKRGFEPVDGDLWSDIPEITFYCGAVNRRAVEAAIQRFERREGAVVNTVFNGCGILTAQMETIRGQQQGLGFPDTYMACDRYYLNSVKDWFQEGVDVSDTDVVIAVPAGNPAGIRNVKDLTKPGLRIAVGQPEQCTIGVLTRRVLEAEGVYEEVMKNVVTQTATSAMLIPTVTTRSVDAALAYATDINTESGKVEAIRIESPSAKAIQPFAVSRSSDHKYLGRRLYAAIARSRDDFEAAGFHFRLDDALNKISGPAGK